MSSKLEIKRVTINPRSKKKRYIFLDKKNNQIKDTTVLTHIKKIYIPPAYTDVKISASSSNYLQATGIDDKGRKQYIYNKTYIAKQTRNKYCALKHFGQCIDVIRNDIKKILKNDKPITNREKIIALVVHILDNCYFRIGNLNYYEDHNSHGVSTLQLKHLEFKKDELYISFIGKKGVLNECSIKDQFIIDLLKELAKLAKNKESFLFYYEKEVKETETETKEKKSKEDKVKEEKELIKPIDINNFLTSYNSDITLKMFRTWAANYIFLEEMIKRQNELVNINNSDNTNAKNNNDTMKVINEIIKNIAIKLHNTPTVSKKSYLDNNLVQIYMDNPKLFWKRIKRTHKSDLNMLLVELLTYNCKEKTKKCKSQV